MCAGCSHYLYAGDRDSVRGVHPGQHTTPRYHRQQGDQRAAPYRAEGVQESLGGERQREGFKNRTSRSTVCICEYEPEAHDSA